MLATESSIVPYFLAFVPYFNPILVCFTAILWKYRKKTKLASVANFIIIIFSVEIILRAEAVEQAQAGDKCDFTGTLIVVPDVAQLSTPGTNAKKLVH